MITVMKKSKSQEFFTEGEFLIDLKNEDRKYFALDEISSDWDIHVYYNVTSLYKKRMTLFYDGNTIVKVIFEHRKVSDSGELIDEFYSESDEYIETDDRKYLLPRTKRGKIKPVSYTNMTGIPEGCTFRVYIGHRDRDNSISIDKLKSYKNIAVGEHETISNMQTKEDFDKFVEWYKSTCHDDYFEKIEWLRSSEAQTRKVKVGDVFRVQHDRTHYCYGVVCGIVRNVEKWDELPQKHSFRSLMDQPLMIRLYELVTERTDMTVEELGRYPLGRLKLCADGDLHYCKHDTIGNKKLETDDIEFNFICTKIVSESVHKTLFTDDMLISTGVVKKPERFDLYVEWGFANAMIKYEDIPQELYEFIKDYRSPHGGIDVGITSTDCGKTSEELMKEYYYRSNLLNPENKDKLNMIFRALGLADDTDFDEFAEKFGGMTREQFIAKMQK